MTPGVPRRGVSGRGQHAGSGVRPSADLCDLAPQIEEAGWSYVGGWTGQGGSKLGTKR